MKWMVAWMILLWAGGSAAAEGSGLLDRARDMASGSVASMVQSQLGVNEEQAEGGIGSMLALARERLNGDDFERLAGAIPGAEGYIETAQSLGAVSGPLSNLADLNAALGRLGISPETAARFVPMVTDLVGKVGGEEAGRLLAAAMGGA